MIDPERIDGSTSGIRVRRPQKRLLIVESVVSLAISVQVTALVQTMLPVYVVAASADNKLHLHNLLRVFGTWEVQLGAFVA